MPQGKLSIKVNICLEAAVTLGGVSSHVAFVG